MKRGLEATLTLTLTLTLIGGMERGLEARIDLPELNEMLIIALADFLALVFTFAGTIFMLENLGNPPGWEQGPEDRTNLSLMKSVWYVIVTVSTVGFGDISPVSFLGKISAMVFMVSPSTN